MKLVFIILACIGGLAVFFLLAYGAFRLLNNAARKRREESIRQAMDAQTDEDDRENVRQMILMRQQMDQSTANSARSDRRN